MFIGHPQKWCDTAYSLLFSLERLPHPDCKSRLPFTDPLNLKMQTCFPERQSGRGEEEEEPINKEDGLMWNRPRGLLMTAGCSLIKHSETGTKSALRVTNSPILPLLHKSNGVRCLFFVEIWSIMLYNSPAEGIMILNWKCPISTRGCDEASENLATIQRKEKISGTQVMAINESPACDKKSNLF